ncbi:MAG TPA: M20/M25/M40 family metallo-hydrolase, partial [Pseudomonadales bacterium]|nr:M20/M25/M40 family metallo-hydrolase [Pseudomonadales bacterium]
NWRHELQNKYTNPLFEVPVPTMNFGCIHGGDNPNRICGACELQIDVRPVPGMDIHELQQILRERVQPIAARHQVKAEVLSLFPGIPPFETPADSEIVKMAERLTGHSAEAVGFGTEASFLNDLGMETIVLGPGNIEQAHQPDEYVEMDRIKPTLALLENLIKKLCL